MRTVEDDNGITTYVEFPFSKIRNQQELRNVIDGLSLYDRLIPMYRRMEPNTFIPEMGFAIAPLGKAPRAFYTLDPSIAVAAGKLYRDRIYKELDFE